MDEWKGSAHAEPLILPPSEASIIPTFSIEEQKAIREAFKRLPLNDGKASELFNPDRLTLKGMQTTLFLIQIVEAAQRGERDAAPETLFESGFSTLKTLDFQLENRARSLNRTVTFFDAKMIHKIATCAQPSESKIREQIVSLARGAENSSIHDSISKLVASYRRGGAELTDYIKKLIEVEGTSFESYFDARHVSWFPTIEASLRAFDRTFIAVGVAHIDLGEQSLRKLFEAKGYTLERVHFKIAAPQS